MRKANDLFPLNIFLAIVIVLATFSGAQSASQKRDKNIIPQSPIFVSSTDFTYYGGCRNDSLTVDIVFVIDTCRDMGRCIAWMRASLDGLGWRLHLLGYDYRFGFIKVCGLPFVVDFDYSPGYQMTDSYVSARVNGFHSMAIGLPPFGAPRVWDAIWDAMDVFDLRPEALKIIVFATTTPSSALDVPGSDPRCKTYADTFLNPYPPNANTLMRAVDEGYLVFALVDTVYRGSYLAPVELWDSLYEKIATKTGGRIFWGNTDWRTLTDTLIPIIDTSQSITLCVSNTTPFTLDTAYVKLLPGDSITLLYGRQRQRFFPWHPGTKHCFNWRVSSPRGYTGPENCFKIAIFGYSSAGTTLTDTVSACMHHRFFSCYGPVAHAICPYIPVPGETVYTSSPRFPIKFHISTSDSAVDTSSIEVLVQTPSDTTIYRYPDHLSLSSDTLTFTPTDDLVEGIATRFYLVSADDTHGCSLKYPAGGVLVLDTTPPIAWCTTSDTINPASVFVEFQLADPVSGIRFDSTLYFVVNDSYIFTIDSSFVGVSLAPPAIWLSGNADELHIPPEDSVKICVHAADNVFRGTSSCPLGEPNETTYCKYFKISTAIGEVSKPKFLIHAFPNPFNDKLFLSIGVTKAERVKICALDLNGREIAKIYDSRLNPGRSTITWCPENIPSGTYIIMLEIGEKIYYKKVKYLK